jgi:hypothetical protein
VVDQLTRGRVVVLSLHLQFIHLLTQLRRSWCVCILLLRPGGAASGNFLYGKEGKDGFNLWVLHEGNVKMHKITRNQATGQLLYNGNASGAKTLAEVRVAPSARECASKLVSHNPNTLLSFFTWLAHAHPCSPHLRFVLLCAAQLTDYLSDTYHEVNKSGDASAEQARVEAFETKVLASRAKQANDEVVKCVTMIRHTRARAHTHAHAHTLAFMKYHSHHFPLYLRHMPKDASKKHLVAAWPTKLTTGVRGYRVSGPLGSGACIHCRCESVVVDGVGGALECVCVTFELTRT